MRIKNKEQIIKGINILGEYVVYLFIFTIFIDSKLNMKIRYVLEGLVILKLLFDRKSFKMKGKNIYLMFGVILLIGTIFNVFSSQYDGVDKFIDRNTRFLSGIMLMFFIDNKRKIMNINNIILLGTTILTIGIWKNYSFLKLDILHQRGILILGACYSLIYLLEKLKKIKEENKLELCLVGLSAMIGIYGVSLSDSRMGFLVVVGIIGLYILYNLFLKFSLKRMIISFLIGISSCFIFYQVSPEWFKKELSTSFETKNNFSNEARLIMWEGSWKAFKSSPLIGVGSSVYDTEPFIIEVGSNTTRGKDLQVAFKQKRFGEAHSIYFNFLSQVGSLTLLYLYVFFIMIPKKFIYEKKNAISVASFFGIFSFLMYGVTWSVWGYYGLVQTLFHMYLGILIINNSIEEEKINA